MNRLKFTTHSIRIFNFMARIKKFKTILPRVYCFELFIHSIGKFDDSLKNGNYQQS